MNGEVIRVTSSFITPCSIFDIHFFQSYQRGREAITPSSGLLAVA